MRITFINETSSVLTDIKISGCDELHIENLKPNEKKLVWVGISGDCSVMIEFIKDGKREKENVVGYTTNGAGDKITYKIEANNIAARN